MIHFIQENKDLKNRKFPLPNGIKKYLNNILKSYKGDKTNDGYKRLNNILNMDGIKYNEMKRIKNFFDNYNGTKKSDEYSLNGGDEMYLWVNNTLNTATKQIQDHKQKEKDAGISNAFIKNHSKNRQTKTNKPSVSKIKTNNLSNRLLNNDDIKYENKIIILTSKQAKLITEEISNYNSFVKELESIRYFKRRYQYCLEHFGKPIGKGSSRAVFKVDNEKVIKLAYNSKGIAQNQVENDYYLYQIGIASKIYYSNDDDTLLISEIATQVKKSDFIKYEGITWDEFCKFITAEDTLRHSRNYKDGYKIMPKERYEYLMDNVDICQAFSEYIGNYNPPIGDLLRIKNYGLVNRDGNFNIVLVDTGLNDEVRKNYY